MNSPYKRVDYKKRSTKQRTSTSAKENSKSITNKKTKNNVLKGDNPRNIFISGKEFIEQVFSKKDKWLILWKLVKKIPKFKMKYPYQLKNILKKHMQQDLKKFEYFNSK